jgi:hypothetical protein
MASFTVRVELHDNPTWGDYDTLHEAMEAEGFSRTIKNSDTGVEYRLPHAEYNFVGSYTRSQVLEKAKRAAAKTGNEFSILVTESNGRAWWNLKLA